MVHHQSPATPSPDLIADNEFVYAQTIPEDDLLRRLNEVMDFSFVRDLVAELYHNDTAKGGRPALDPVLMAKVSLLQWLYNMSDREVTRACQQRLDFKWFLGLAVHQQAPFDDSSLCRTRRRWGEATAQRLHEATVARAQALGFVGRERLIDSSKMLMNAAVLTATAQLKKATRRMMKALRQALPKAQLAAAEAELKDLEDDTSWYLDDELKQAHYLRWGELARALTGLVPQYLATPPATRSQRWLHQLVRQEREFLLRYLDGSTWQRALVRDSKRAWRSRPDQIVTDVDLDARRAAEAGGKVRAGYKTHVSMDTQSGVVTGVCVTPMNTEDGTQLLPLVEDEQARGLEIARVTADRAYSDGAIRAGLEARQQPIEAFIPEPKSKRSKQGLYKATAFHFDAAAKTVTCPQGYTHGPGRVSERRGGWNFHFPRELCADCPLQDRCVPPPKKGQALQHGRTVYVNQHRALHDAARRQQATPEHKTAMKVRLRVEGKQSEMLNQHGLRWARYRGLLKARVQGYWTAVAVNCKRLTKLAWPPGEPPKLLSRPARGVLSLVT